MTGTLAAAAGTLSASKITNYQKNSVVVSGAGASATIQNNTVTGQGPISDIAQNVIQVSYGGSATVKNNTVSGNWYTPTDITTCGPPFYQAGGVKQSGNTLDGNETRVCDVSRGAGNAKP